MRMRIAAFVMIGSVGMMLFLAACGSSSNVGRPAASSVDTFTLSEFTIVPPTNTLRAGSILLTADNVGAETHELVIFRAASVQSLPTKADGSVDEEKVPAADKVGEIENIASRSHRTKSFDLTSGSYVAFCNIVDNMMGSDTTMMNGMGSGMGGHVHFAQGMHVAFTVQ